MYCVAADLFDVFGMLNVKKWADLDNDQDLEKIEARITSAISRASGEIDDWLRDRYDVPFNPVPSAINEVASILAGVRLYENRGIEDIDPETGRPVHRLAHLREAAKRTLQEILSGQRRLDAPTQVTARPKVVK